MLEYLWIFGGMVSVGLLLMLLLDFGINQARPQMRLTYYFMKHPTRFEIIVQSMIISVPIYLSYSLLNDLGFGTVSNLSEVLMVLISIVLVSWPIIMYRVHTKLIDDYILLGFSSTKRGKLDPITEAKIIAVVWIGCVFVFLSVHVITVFCIFPLLGRTLEIISFLGILILPIKKSLTKLRARSTPKSQQEIQ